MGTTIEVTAFREVGKFGQPADSIRIVYATDEAYHVLPVGSDRIDELVEKILNAKRRLKGGR